MCCKKYHPAGYPMAVGMPCGPSGSSRSDGGSLGAHMSTPPWRLHVRSAHDTGRSLHSLTGQRGVDREWLWGGIVRGVAFLGQWRDPGIAAVHSQPSRIETAARIPPSKSGEPRHILQEGVGLWDKPSSFLCLFISLLILCNASMTRDPVGMHLSRLDGCDGSTFQRCFGG